MMGVEDPLLRRTRVEAANAMANNMIDVINAHVRLHGSDDPELVNILLAAFATVVGEIDERVTRNFSMDLAGLLLEHE